MNALRPWKFCQGLLAGVIFISLHLAVGVHNCQLVDTVALANIKGLSQDEGWADFAKISASLPSINTYRMTPLSARSISIDSTFKHQISGLVEVTEACWTDSDIAHCSINKDFTSSC
jgi:hypothetical protein